MVVELAWCQLVKAGVLSAQDAKVRFEAILRIWLVAEGRIELPTYGL